jgi:oxygen-independent coproporphyrinogen-3 oxidase
MGVTLPRTVDTVYLGGGTPSLLSAELIARLFASVRANFQIENRAEITVECAPGQLSDATLDAMVHAGVNRVSLGVQSFVDREAQVSGRLHNRSMVLDDLRRLRVAGIDNLNIDLIAGLAGQTFASWKESLNELVQTGVPHASVYMLEVDEDSRLGRELLKSGTRYHAGLVPTDDAIAEMYETAIVTLENVGLKQYEISNFAQHGKRSAHNMRYWQRQPYLGVGLDASSALQAVDDASESAKQRRTPYVLRSTTSDDLADYLAGTPAVETAWLSPDRQHEEAWFLGLRLNQGVALTALRREFGRAAVEPVLAIVEQLVETGLVASDGKTVRLTPQGHLLSNDVFQQFLATADSPELNAASLVRQS